MWPWLIMVSVTAAALAAFGFAPEKTLLAAILFAAWGISVQLAERDAQLGRVLADIALRVEALRKGEG